MAIINNSEASNEKTRAFLGLNKIYKDFLGLNENRKFVGLSEIFRTFEGSIKIIRNVYAQILFRETLGPLCNYFARATMSGLISIWA